MVKFLDKRRNVFETSYYCFNLREVLFPYKEDIKLFGYSSLREVLEHYNFVLDISDGVIEELTDSDIDEIVERDIKFINIKMTTINTHIRFDVFRLSNFDFDVRSVSFRGKVSTKVLNKFSFNLGTERGVLCLVDRGAICELVFKYDNIDMHDIFLCSTEYYCATENVDFQLFELHGDVLELYLILGYDYVDDRKLGVFAFNIKTGEVTHAFIYGVDCKSNYIDTKLQTKMAKLFMRYGNATT